MNIIKFPILKETYSILGLFDSGLGGLTVLKELQKAGIADRYVYIGDTAYLPYGEKTVEQLQQRADIVASFLVSQGVTTCIIACHTLSAVAYEYLRKRFPTITFIGMIEIVAHHALAQSKNKKIGVLATHASISSHAHYNALLERDRNCVVIEQACPKIVPLLETLPFQEIALKEVIAEYVKPLLDKEVDTIILGSTHYALIKPMIAKIVGPFVTLIGAEDILVNNVEKKARANITECYVTGDSFTFEKKAKALADIQLCVKSLTLY